MAKQTRKPIELLPPSESVEGILAALDKTGGNVSDERKQSVESHLRAVIRLFGFKPRETKEKPATIGDLAKQVFACFQNGAPPETNAAMIQMHLHATHSNVTADTSLAAVPEVKEVPALKEVPGKVGKAVETAGKVAALFILSLLLLFTQGASAMDNFNFTNNLLGSGSAVVVSSYPTNLLSTNLTITSYTTNGSIITTNGFYLGQNTGGAIWVKNFSGDGVGFFVKGYSLTNLTSVWTIKLIRSWADNPPLVIWNTNTSTIATNDWESVTPPITLAFTVSGTGPFEWGTNLDAYQLGNCTYLGIWASTNAAFGSTNIALTNVVMGLQKNIKPRSLSGGNF